jgi:hypothetical protein
LHGHHECPVQLHTRAHGRRKVCMSGVQIRLHTHTKKKSVSGFVSCPPLTRVAPTCVRVGKSIAVAKASMMQSQRGLYQKHKVSHTGQNRKKKKKRASPLMHSAVTARHCQHGGSHDFDVGCGGTRTHGQVVRGGWGAFHHVVTFESAEQRLEENGGQTVTWGGGGRKHSPHTECVPATARRRGGSDKPLR